ncbi:MAG TPA: glycine--tRNA ligase [Polyangia bacterium]|jgi:glycyl-tRNA synthetase, dimeric type|nr:glycine--tRNA ligase [Polyangia bacterium]
MPASSLETIVSLCKRRGFVFPSSSVYGGLGSTWDYGPLGVELKNNVKRAWWRTVVHERDDMEGLDAAILMNRLVWKYSGHEATFSDPMTDCRACKARPRADHVFAMQKGRDPKGLVEINAAIAAKELACPKCGSKDLTEARPFNLMFRTSVGPVDTGDESGLVYLRPETAQGMFVNFGNVLDTMRRKLPFGIAQVGKAFRNEITPGNFTFRTREFEQMEIEYFVRPGEDEAAHEMWIAERKKWYLDLGIRAENLRVREQEKHELAHYAKRCVDLEYLFPMGWSELEGIANRTDFDLKAHSRSPENPDAVGELHYFDQEQKKHYVPYVIEPSAGADRGTLAFLCDAYDDSLVKQPPAEDTAKLRELVESFARSVGRREGMDADVKQRLQAAAESIAAGLPATLPTLIGLMDDAEANKIEVMKKVRGVGEKIAEEHTRTVLHLHPRLAPLTVAVFPLKRNEPRLVELARGIKRDLQRAGLRAVYDDTGAIGKLYRRQDEIGTPWCITVDFQSLDDKTVTVRDRDSMQQERAPLGELGPTLLARLR